MASNRTICVSGFPAGTTEEELRSFFESLGTVVTDVAIIEDPTDTSRGSEINAERSAQKSGSSRSPHINDRDRNRDRSPSHGSKGGQKRHHRSRSRSASRDRERHRSSRHHSHRSRSRSRGDRKERKRRSRSRSQQRRRESSRDRNRSESSGANERSAGNRQKESDRHLEKKLDDLKLIFEDFSCLAHVLIQECSHVVNYISRRD